ncbi:hypothetical protein HNP84_000795 [Thermocatellispora tengchongensis]|uniref:Carbon monoxide dehydrogenase n=1 Tax=Thermocatellispora tengchongensis TaxID=1073253 RepID=A0A840NWA6_9ACTN|nr:carbon monoxide dehydrogenase subunit G [Thermocatellispora tengchongensis]MBB5131089.1 hypothetical protein [Thermocatellispora tengchongensis]
MKVVGSALVGVGRRRLWDALLDPDVLVRTIPGCERLEALGGDAYRMTVTAGVASIKGVYQGEVALTDMREPEAFVMKAGGQGAPGTVDATVNIRLSDADGGGTRIDYDAEAVVGGMIGGVGQRMLTSVAKRTADEFFTALERHLTEEPVTEPAAVQPAAVQPAAVQPAAVQPAAVQPAAVQPAAEPAAVESAPVTEGAAAAEVPAREAGQVYVRPAPERAPAPRSAVPAWTMLAAFGMGAGVALGSATIGWLLGRATRRA